MRVLLIFPPGDVSSLTLRNVTPPLGIAYLAASLERDGHEAALLDCQIEGLDRVTRLPGGRIRFGLPPAQIVQRIEACQPDVVGVSCLFSQMERQAKDVLRLAKQARPRAVTVFGGFHPTLFPADALAEPAADIVMRGPGERSFPALLAALASGGDMAGVPGAVTRSSRDLSSEPPLPPFIHDLDNLPFPAWRLLPMEKYFAANFPHNAQARAGRVMAMITSRGCPHRCGFCQASMFWGRRIAFRSPENVIEEIAQLRRDFGVQEIHFEDDNLALDRNRALTLFHLLAERFPGMAFNAPCAFSPDELSDEMLEALAKCGFYEVNIAVESGSPRVLTEIVGKPDFLAELPRIVATCKRLGLLVHGLFVVGFFGETRSELRQTLRLPLALGFTDAQINDWIPLHGTRLFREAVEQGFIRPEDVTFLDVHTHGRVPRYQGITNRELFRAIALTNWRIKLRMLLRRPRVFYRRYGRVLAKNPGTFVRFFVDQARAAMMPVRRAGGPAA
jgi:magnesium-protoporphyrin IX monomethyl ester (oxidative) cyclase